QPLGTELTDGVSTVDFGSNSVGSRVERTFAIKNIGNANLTGLGISFSGPNSSEFMVTLLPVAPVPGFGGNTTFTVAFVPGATGQRSATLHLASNDSDESP